MSRLLCCLCRRLDMGVALSQEGESCDGAGLPAAPPTMADVIRERKKKAGGAGLGTLRRRIAAAARRPRDARPDRGCEHARFIRTVVGSWRLAEVFLLCADLEAGAALRDLVTQAELAREPAAALHADLHRAYSERWWCDVELVGAGWSVRAHRAVLAARCTYFRELLQRYPPSVVRVPLDGACAGLSRAELAAAVCALYACTCAAPQHNKWECSTNADGDLDIISGDGAYSCRSNSLCRCGRGEGAGLPRLRALLGQSPDALHTDMRYLLESGEMSDCRLSWGSYELPAHRLVLAARSRYFRSVMSRRAAGGAVGPVCVDEQVLPRRFARALLRAAYTDQVDLSLIGRNSSSPSSTNSTGSGGTAWTGSRGRATSTATLDDAFQLYEIARFLEMPIVVQGCEDAIVEALSADTLPHVLRWAAHAHASRWVHRQAMRYLRDEFPTLMAHAAAARLPRAALVDALGSPFLQASEAQALRALWRWAEQTQHAKQQREPNVVWHTGHAAARRGARRRPADAALREAMAELLPLVRLDHLPPDHEPLQQMVRRGLIPAPASTGEEGSTADAWLGRGAHRPARCFIPYLDELKALLEGQAVPEAELARLRRARYMHRIPDTLYMVAAARNNVAAPAGQGALEGACVSPRVLAALRARARELCAAPPAARALRLHAHDPAPVREQIALRAVREMSLPDSCAELLLTEDTNEREREWDSPGERRRWDHESTPPDCCRRSGSAGSAGSSRSYRGVRAPCPADQAESSSRSSTCRRELPSRSVDGTQHRQSTSSCGGAVPRATLSAAVPDVTMAPNANTHLLTQPAYAPEYSAGVLQLDLGDGATHTPRPGSRAARAMAAQHATRHRETSQAIAAAACRARDDDEIRTAIELSVMRGTLAYSMFHPRAHSPALLPPLHARRPPASAPASANASAPAHTTAVRSRASPSPSALSASNSAHLAHLPAPRATHHASHHSASHHPQGHRSLTRVGSSGLSGLGAAGAGGASGSTSPSASPSPRRHKSPRDYRLEPSYGSSGSGSRGQSPSNYA
ncbi:BTB/POZ domain-containing protein 7 [Ostrinia furnacalis]|uniref:BTB/POZ domain-containing protein 7 n=1 Tax=Ostrinia furnacalis TaxID=93504 RepID=UPI00103B4256|nr:BTB/POZ domain-containing protein 7 [Ostrinia furnacalis]